MAEGGDRWHLIGFASVPVGSVPSGYIAVPASEGTLLAQEVGPGFGVVGCEDETRATIANAWIVLCRLAETTPVAAFRFGQVVAGREEASRAAGQLDMANRLRSAGVQDCEEWSIAFEPDPERASTAGSYLARLSAGRRHGPVARAAFERALEARVRGVERRKGEGDAGQWQALTARSDREAFLAALASAAEAAGGTARVSGPEPVLTFIRQPADA